MLKKTTTENKHLHPVLKPIQELVFKENNNNKTISTYSLDEKPLVTFKIKNKNHEKVEIIPNDSNDHFSNIKHVVSHFNLPEFVLKPLNTTIPKTIIDLKPEQRIFVEGNTKHNPLITVL